MLETIIFIVVITVIAVSYLICCIVSLKKSIKDRREILNRRIDKANLNSQKDGITKSAHENLVVVPLPKFALSKTNKNDKLDMPNTDTTKGNVHSLDAHPKEGLRNFSYKLSMSGEYEHIYAREHFQNKTNKV